MAGSKKSAPKPRMKTQKVPLAPKITFVGGKWYNELGQEVPKPKPLLSPGAFAPSSQPQAQAPEQLQRYVRMEGCTCTRPEKTGHVSGCKYFADSLYVCEQALRSDMLRFFESAKISHPGQTLADLQYRRINAVEHSLKDSCPDDAPQAAGDPRRRCWMCPYWTRHPNETPFDHQKPPAAQIGLDQFPEALNDDDDDLPF